MVKDRRAAFRSAALKPFQAIPQREVPHGRTSRHKAVVTRILAELEALPRGSALKIPLADLGDGKARVRSALMRAARKAGRRLATASDEAYLYVWHAADAE